MFIQAIDDVAPEKEIRIKGRTEPWIDEEILKAIHERDRVLSIANSNRSNKELRAQYNTLRNKVIKLSRHAKASHSTKQIK